MAENSTANFRFDDPASTIPGKSDKYLVVALAMISMKQGVHASHATSHVPWSGSRYCTEVLPRFTPQSKTSRTSLDPFLDKKMLIYAAQTRT